MTCYAYYVVFEWYLPSVGLAKVPNIMVMACRCLFGVGWLVSSGFVWSGIADEIAAGISWNRSADFVCVVWLGLQLRSPSGDFLESQCVVAFWGCVPWLLGLQLIALWGSPGIAASYVAVGCRCVCFVIRVIGYQGPHASIKAGSWPPVVPPCQWIRSGRAAAGGPRLSPNLAVTPFWGALGGAGLAKVVARALLGPGLALGTRWCFRQGYPNQGRYKLWLGGAGVVWRWRARASFTWASAGLCTCWGSDC